MGKKKKTPAGRFRCPEKGCISRDQSCNDLEEGFDHENCDHYMTMEILSQASRPDEPKEKMPGQNDNMEKFSSFPELELVKRIGGKLWVSKEGDKHRAYFNQPLLGELCGIAVTIKDLHVYKESIISATMNGEPISIDESLSIFYSLKHDKIWYDFDEKKFTYRGNPVIFPAIIKKLEGLLSQGQVEKTLETT